MIDLLGLSRDYLEPLQIVSYTSGQITDLKNDGGVTNRDINIVLNGPKRLSTETKLLMFILVLFLIHLFTYFSF